MSSTQVEDSTSSQLDLLEFSASRRVRLILQTEVAECGLACLAMVADYHGFKTDLRTLRQRTNVSFGGLNLQQLIEYAGSVDLSARALKCPVESIQKLSLPCILHWDMTHFVVLTGFSKNRVRINDPAKGKRSLTIKEFSEHFTGVALELTPTAKFQRVDLRHRMGLNQLWSRITGLKSGLLALLLLSVIIQVLVLIMPYYLQWVVDEVLLSRDRAFLNVLAIGFGLLVLLNVITAGIRGYLILKLSSMLNMQMGVNLLNHLLKLPLSFFEKRHIGDLISRFGSLNSIREQLTTGFVSALVDGLLGITILIIMFAYSHTLTTIVLLSIGLYCCLRLGLYESLKRATEDSIHAQAKEQSNFLENIRGIQTIKLFTSEGLRLSLWQNRFANVINADIKLGKLSIGFEGALGTIFGIENIIVIYIAALSVISGSLSIGMVLAFIAYKNQLTDRAIAFIEQVIAFKMLRLHLDRISDIALEEEEPYRHTQVESPNIFGKLELRNICFRYSPSAPWVIKNLNLVIEPGQCVALAGASGCGKSTLIKIMLGLLEPDEGIILLDGVEITKIGLVKYREMVAAVMQDDSLLSGSIIDNISFFDPKPNIHLAQQCARIAAIDTEMSEMAMGYNTLVGDMGNGFSGGQVQRLLLARALYKKPKILFLDEATSHLDSDNETKIVNKISHLPMTRIIISHRYETVSRAERKFLLQDGQIIEQ